MLAAFLVILWFVGGSSRADVSGQAIVRLCAWGIVIGAIFALPRLEWRTVKEPLVLFVTVTFLVVFQLVPLPPSIWTALPGRAIFAEAALLAGADQPWRPLSISPSGTSNALSSLIVPATVLLLAANLSKEHHWRIAILILSLVVGGAIVGVLQFSGSRFENPFINSGFHPVSGNFANRNHFALFLAIGCALALSWAFRRGAVRWRAMAALGLVALFVLMILASGSRSGVIVGVLGLALAGMAVRLRLIELLRALPRNMSALLAASGICVLAGLIWLSVSLGRATSVQRGATLDSAEDLRWEIWPVVLDITQRYFPMGTGFGTFAPIFRVSEPDSLLQNRYINLAHNDWMQIVLEGGILGGIVSGIALFWFIRRSLQAWSSGSSLMLAKVGSIVIALILAASVTDYPSRTPMVMAVLTIAAVWLANVGLKPVDANKL